MVGILAVIMATSLTPIAVNGLDLFAMQYMSHYLTQPVAPFHRSWTDGLAGSDRYLYFEAMRGGAKTTWCDVINGTYQAVESGKPELHIISQSGGPKGLSTKIMRLIRKELETNEDLQDDYQYRQGKPWGDEHIQVVRADGSTFDIYCRGKGGSIRGCRGDIIIDDPQDALDCESETVLQHDEQWFFTDVLPVLLPHNRLIFVATPISPLSLASKVKQLPGFKVLSAPLEVPYGSGLSAWPGQYPNEFVAERKAMMGIEQFDAEYNCLPRVSGNPVFRPEWFRHYDPGGEEFAKTKRELQYIVLGMDCAESERTQADETALVTLGATYGTKPDVYVLDVRHGHWTTTDGASQVFHVHRDWQQHKSIVESRVSGTATEGGDAMIHEIRRQEHTYGRNVNLYPFKPVKDKVTRAMDVQGFCQQGRVYLNHHDVNHQALLSQLTMFTGNKLYHDDLVDAFDSALYDIQERGGGSRTRIESGYKNDWT